MPPPRGSSPAARQQLQLMWRIAGLAIMVGAEAAAGAGIGWLIDRWAGTGSRWTVICGAIGIVVGLTTFVKTAFQLARESGPRKRGHDDQRGNGSRPDA